MDIQGDCPRGRRQAKLNSNVPPKFKMGVSPDSVPGSESGKILNLGTIFSFNYVFHDWNRHKNRYHMTLSHELKQTETEAETFFIQINLARASDGNAWKS